MRAHVCQALRKMTRHAHAQDMRMTCAGPGTAAWVMGPPLSGGHHTTRKPRCRSVSETVQACITPCKHWHITIGGKTYKDIQV
jgi:hypothetical protein